MSRRSQRDIVFVERDSSSPVWWLVVGGAVGAGLALLFAPDSGSKTRRLLARRLARLRRSAETALGELREAATEEEDLESEAESEIEEAEDELDDVDEEEAEEVTEPALSARDELEKRLAAARARRQRDRADEDEEPVA